MNLEGMSKEFEDLLEKKKRLQKLKQTEEIRFALGIIDSVMIKLCCIEAIESVVADKIKLHKVLLEEVRNKMEEFESIYYQRR